MQDESITPKKSEWRRKDRERRKALGICVACSEPARPNRTTCVACGEKAVIASKQWAKRHPEQFKEINKRYYERNIDVVKERLNQINRKRTTTRKANGLCVRCGEKAVVGPKGGMQHCGPCGEKYREVYMRTPKRMKKAQEDRFRAMRHYDVRCGDCGFDHPATLEFHHLSGEERPLAKRESQGSLISRIAASGPHPDIVLVCANCHRLRHHSHLYEDFT